MKKTTALYVTLTLAIALALALPGMAFGLEGEDEPAQEPATAVTPAAPAATDLEKEVVTVEEPEEASEEPSGEDEEELEEEGLEEDSDDDDGDGVPGNGDGTSGEGDGTSGNGDGNGTSSNVNGASGDGANGSGATNGTGGSGSTAGGSDAVTGGSGSTSGDANDGQANAAGQASNAPSASSGEASAAPAAAASIVSQQYSVKPAGASAPAQAATPAAKAAPQAAAKEQPKSDSNANAKAVAKSAAAAKTAATAKVATNAQVLKAGTYVLVAGTARGKVLDVEGANKRAGANVIIWTYNGGANQKWTVKYLNGWAVVYGIGGNVLEVAGSKAKNGLNVRMGSYKGSANQRWTVMANKDGSVYLASALNSGYRLDITGQSGRDGTNVELWSGNSTKAQKFEAQEANPRVAASAKLAEGWYTLRSALNGSYYLDVTGCNATNGTPLELWTGNTSPAQAFRLIKVGQYYRLETGSGAGSYLDVEGGKVVPGTKAEVWRSNTNCALFSLQYEKSLGGYRLVNVASGLALAPTSGKATKGARVTAERSVAGSKAQTFVFLKQPGLLKEGTYRINTNLSGGRSVTVKNGSWSNGAATQIASYKQDFSQKWQVKGVSGKTNVYTIENLSSGYKLAGANNAAATQRNATDSSVWWVPTYSNGGYCLKNVKTGKALDVAGASGKEGTQLMSWTPKSRDNANQRWQMTQVAAVDSGVYELLDSANVKFALDVHGASLDNGANVEVYTRKGSGNQKWVYDAKTGTITALVSGKRLDVSGASKASGASVIQWADNGGSNQKWTITYEGGGKFKVASKMGNSLVLTATKASNSADVTSSTDKGAASQRWRLVRSGNVQPTGFNLITSIVSQGHGSLNASYIVIHETANPGATAKNHRDYWKNNDTYAVHYTLDWTGDCYYCVPENRLCWQVGNGNPYVVGIELCHATNQADFNKVYNAGVQWARWQLAKNGWGVDRLICHDECRTRWGGTDHTDPIDYFATYGKSWSQFKADVKKALAAA